MIISASRRTDIPAFYSDWFFNRIKEGFLYVRNPMNIYQVSKIKLTPDVVDFIVFWTKNPTPMLDRLDKLKDFPFYFQFTVTSYSQDIETNVPSKNKVIIPAFKKLSDKIGNDKVVWRYDPIILNPKYTKEYHYENFEKLAKILSGYTEKCTISFLDFYAKTERNMRGDSIIPFAQNDIDEIAKTISDIAKSYNLKIDTCAESVDLDKYGIAHAHCIDSDLIEKISGYKFKLSKDKNQRKECGCVESIDIGAYNTCQNGCKYCYANYNQGKVKTNSSSHNPNSPFLYGELNPEKDKITERKMKSLKIPIESTQLKLGL